jgi:hypothetical protein
MKKSIYLFIMMIFGYGTLFAQEVGAPAPDFTHDTIAHGTISLSDFQGKVVYLFFFGWA